MRVLTLVALVGTLAVLAGSGAAGNADTTAVSTFRRTAVFSTFNAPVLLTYAPGEPGMSYIVEQPGRILRINPKGVGSTFLDIERLVDYGGERGLLGLAFDPGYRKNRLFYVAYTSKGGQNVVARYRSTGRETAIPSTRRILLSAQDPYGNHNGGQLAFGPDGRLYTSIGDGGSGGDPEDRAQNMRSSFGKLLALNVSKPNANWAIAGLGLRNPWRFTFDRATGDLYIGDVGQNAVEEVDYTPRRSPGLENYGWDVYEGTRRHEDGELGPGRLVNPVFEYGRDEGNCTVVGGYVYRGSARPDERGRYIFGDYCSGIVWSLRVKAGKAQGVRREPFRIEGLTSFGENAAGELYATTESGTIYRIS